MSVRPLIAVIEKPDPELRGWIPKPLSEFNAGRTGVVTPEPVAVLLLDPESGRTVGGLWAVSVYDWLYVELVFVPEELRAQGLGTSLMLEAESLAKKKCCIGMRLDTFSFQAPAFYEKLGYQVFGRLENLPRGHDRTYYFKLRREGTSSVPHTP